METFASMIARALDLPEHRVVNTIHLLEEGATIPFISRYRKEATGGLTEVAVSDIKDRNEKLHDIQRRKETILKTIDEQGRLSDELRQRIEACWDSTELEDIYLPYRPKRKTRAEVARKRGLAPLADVFWQQKPGDPAKLAVPFVDGVEVPDVEAALQGARDILAERINEDEGARNTLRRSYELTAVIFSKVVKGKEAEGAKYRDYFDFHEPLRRCSSHRLLALRRGEAEGFLRVAILPADEADSLSRISRRFVRSGFSSVSQQVELAAGDAYRRLLRPSIETEFAAASKHRADEEAIRVFARNLRQLLLAPPLGPHRIMGIDPGFRTGCKVVCLDEQGNLLHNDTIYPHPPVCHAAEATAKLLSMISDFRIEAVAIGSGTAGRETEEFVKSLPLADKVRVFLVSEDGASVYSASKLAREEFPNQDVTVRGAVSIARRLADPLAELVKIDPKSIGVGQYQHDVDQGELKKALDRTVEFCVNTVGVNLNTASKHLLTYVSGLGPVLAQNIVNYRIEHGPFRSRKGLLEVPRLGAKAFEQCAGFLRIDDGDNPLDNTAVHPERYALVEQMAHDAGCEVPQLIASKEIRRGIDLQRYCKDGVGMPTLRDIMEELDKPGRDMRGEVRTFSFAPDLHTLDDLVPGMVVPGVVTNITNFGCFVDMGIKTKGLIHVSQLANRFVRDPNEIVSLGQQLRVKVMAVDTERGRVSLTLKGVKQ